MFLFRSCLTRSLAASYLLSICSASTESTLSVKGGAGPVATPPPSAYHNAPQTLQKRALDDFIKSFASNVAAPLATLGAEVGELVTSKISQQADFLADLPSQTAVQSYLDIDDAAVGALPTEVLNLPNYGNWTADGWQLRVRANVYSQPDVERKQLLDLANNYFIDNEIQDVPSDEQDQAINITRDIFVIQQGDATVTFFLPPVSPQESLDDDSTASPQKGQHIVFPDPTCSNGDIDGFLHVDVGGLVGGGETSNVQRLNVYAEGSSVGNATSFLVPPNGLTVISDIDDVLRVAKIWDPKEGLLNTFGRPFQPWLNMPQIFSNWSDSLSGVHFHYLTTTPEQISRAYIDFLFKTYPLGSFDSRPLNLSDVSNTFSARRYLLERMFQTFPDRQYVLIGDTGNTDVLRDYPDMAMAYPDSVKCIFVRNTSATDESDVFPYNTKNFKELDESTYMFFNVPDDLAGLDIANGQCRNDSVPQDVWFDFQGLPDAAGMLSPSFFTLELTLGAMTWFVL